MNKTTYSTGWQQNANLLTLKFIQDMQAYKASKSNSKSELQSCRKQTKRSYELLLFFTQEETWSKISGVSKLAGAQIKGKTMPRWMQRNSTELILLASTFVKPEV